MLKWNNYDTITHILGLQGYNVIPLLPRTKGTKGTFRWAPLNRPTAPRVSLHDLANWKQRLESLAQDPGTVGAYLLPGSGQTWAYVIVDLDGADLAHVTKLFGKTPLYTSRNGEIKHLYFRSQKPVKTCTRVEGPKSYDIIGTTGIVLPGSQHEDGHFYTLSIPIEQWTTPWVQKNVPLFRAQALDKIRANRKPVTQEVREDLAHYDPHEGFLHAEIPIETRTSIWCGHVLSGTPILCADNTTRPLGRISDGTRVFATYRKDSRPSAQVRVYKNRKSLWDWSMTPPRYWTMVEALDHAHDPNGTIEEIHSRLGVQIVTLHNKGYLQIPPIPDDTTAFILAPHGSGKTYFAKSEHDRARTSISVCNTQALTIANAAVLNLRAVYEGVSPEPKGSCCIPSLPRYSSPPEFFHVDEADQVHGFLHSGMVRNALECWQSLAHFLASSKRALVTSADLSYEDLALFVHAIRNRNATRKLILYTRSTKRNSEITITLKSIGHAKAQLHDWLTTTRKSCTYVGTTTRKLAGAIAQAYQGNRRKVADLSTPEPESTDYGTHASTFFVTGENNRFHETVKWLGDPQKLVRDHDLIVVSPALQSGISLTPPISRVFLLHEHRSIPADTVLQMARRARTIKNKEIVLGIRNWKPFQVQTDRASLDALAQSRAQTTRKAIALTFPEYEDNTPCDPEFAWSWRITMRKLLQSYADPIGEIQKACKRHGFTVRMAIDSSPIIENPFHEITKPILQSREHTWAHAVCAAPEIDFQEIQRLERAPILKDGERQRLMRAQIVHFYGSISPELVTLDNHGKFRKTVRAYTHARLLDAHELSPIALIDQWGAWRRQPTEYAHVFARAAIHLEIVDTLAGGFAASVCSGDGATDWWLRHYRRAVTFFPRWRGPRPDKGHVWLAERLRELGATVEGTGVSWDRVDSLAEHYAAGILRRAAA